MKKLEGGWALAVCALGWSLAGVFMKYVNINSFAMAGFRSTFAFITIAAFSRKLPRFVIRNNFDRGDRPLNDANVLETESATGDNTIKSKTAPAVIKGDRPPIDRKRTLCLWLATLNYAITMILFCLCNKLTYSANAVILQYTNPAWIILLSPWLVGEKNRKIDYAAIGGIVIGMMFFFADTIFGEPSGELAETATLGNILALVSGITFGLTTIFQRKQQMLAEQAGDTQSGNTSRDAFMLAQIITALFGLPFAFISENGIPDGQSLLFLILLGVFQMGIPNITYSIGIKKVRALSASLITMLEPLMNPVWVLIFVREIPSWYTIVGGVIILGCILGREIIGTKKESR